MHPPHKGAGTTRGGPRARRAGRARSAGGARGRASGSSIGGGGVCPRATPPLGTSTSTHGTPLVCVCVRVPRALLAARRSAVESLLMLQGTMEQGCRVQGWATEKQVRMTECALSVRRQARNRTSHAGWRWCVCVHARARVRLRVCARGRRRGPRALERAVGEWVERSCATIADAAGSAVALHARRVPLVLSSWPSVRTNSVPIAGPGVPPPPRCD